MCVCVCVETLLCAAVGTASSVCVCVCVTGYDHYFEVVTNSKRLRTNRTVARDSERPSVMKRDPYYRLPSLMDVGQLNRNVTSSDTRLTSIQKLLRSLGVGGTLNQIEILPPEYAR